MQKTNKLKIAITIETIIFGLLLWPVIGIAGLSVMIFDAPGSTESFYLQNVFFATLSVPISMIGSTIFAWVFYRAKKYKKAIFFMFLPLVSFFWLSLAVFLLIRQDV